MIQNKNLRRFFKGAFTGLLLAAVLMLSSCGEQKENSSNKGPANIENPDKAGLSPKGSAAPKFRAIVDQLRVRNSPDLDSEVIGVLHEGETMTSLGVDSDEQIEVTLRGKKVKAPFKKVIINDGKTGWVFGGAVAPATGNLSKPNTAADLKDYQKLLDGLAKKKASNLGLASDELLKRFSNDPKSADQAIAAYLRWAREALFPMMDEFLTRKDLDQFDLVAWNPDNKPIPESVKKAEAEYKKHGLYFITPEGMINIDFAPGHWEKTFRKVASPTMQSYLKQVSLEQKEGFAEDAGLSISPSQLAKRVIFWEKFRKDNPDFPLAKDIKQTHSDYLMILVSGLDNTPYCTFNDGHPVDPEFRKAYEMVLEKTSSGKSRDVIKGWYDILKEKDFKGGKDPAQLSSNYLDKVDFDS